MVFSFVFFFVSPFGIATALPSSKVVGSKTGAVFEVEAPGVFEVLEDDVKQSFQSGLSLLEKAIGPGIVDAFKTSAEVAEVFSNPKKRQAFSDVSSRTRAFFESCARFEEFRTSAEIFGPTGFLFRVLSKGKEAMNEVMKEALLVV